MREKLDKNKKMYRMSVVFFVILLLLLSFAFIQFNAHAEQLIVGEDDIYTKDVEIGESDVFRWTVYKNTTIDYAVTVKVDGLDDWEKSIDPAYFVLDENNQHQIVSLDFEVPLYPDEDRTSATVIFNFRELGGREKHQITKDVTVNVLGIPPTEDANTIVGGFPNPLPRPLDNPYGAFVLNLAIWSVVGLVVYFIVSPIVHKFTKRTKTNLNKILVKMIRKPLVFFIFLYGLITSILRLDLRLELRSTAFQIYSLLIVIIAVYVTYRIYDAFLNEIAVRRKEEAFVQILKPLLEKVGGIIIVLGGLIIGLRTIGIEITALLAGAGIMGLVVAFAAQDTLSNFFSGMHLLLDRPFSIGEIILLETGEYCRIEDIGMRSTKLYNIRDHESIVLPNNSLANQKIVNIAQPDTTLRIPINVGVAYGSDIKKVKQILYEVAEEHPDVITDELHQTQVRFKEFADSSLNFTLRVWIDDLAKQWTITGELREKIDERFREAKITIPFPQRTVWMHQEDRTL